MRDCDGGRRGIPLSAVREEGRQDLIRLMHEPRIAYVSGGHLSTMLKTEDYMRTIREFLDRTFGTEAAR